MDTPEANEPVSISALAAGNLHHIFSYLPPKDLCRVSATCKHWRDLSHDQAANRAWRYFYEQRWITLRAQEQHSTCWQTEYGSKMKRVSCWSRKHYQQDSLYGHSSGVQCLGIMRGHGVAATGSSDRTVKVWDMRAGMPLATSKLHGGTVRCLAVDEDMLISGSSDHKLRVWLADRNSKAGFDLSDPIRLVKGGHTGPVAAVALDGQCIYSGSWDYSVRVWHRSSLTMAGVVPFDDWVFSLASRGDHLLAGISSRLHVLDVHTLKPLKRIWHQAGAVTNVEGTKDGRIAFSGAQDGRILAHDLRLPDASATIATLWETSAGVGSLTLEDPWLAAALSDGTVALLNTEVAMRQRHHGRPSSASLPPRRVFQLPGGAAYCADLADQWLIAGSESGMTCSWDFTRAEEKEQQVRAAKAARGKARQQKAERHSQRLTQQREKAAMALARLTANPLEADANEQERDSAQEHGSMEGSSVSDEHMGIAANQACSHDSRAAHMNASAEPILDARDRAEAWQMPNRYCSQAEHRQTAALQGARSLPVTIRHHAQSQSAEHEKCDMQAESASPMQVGSAPMRRLAGVAGYSRHMTVPGPLLHSCAIESRRDSPSSMQSWQIVRPRPVKSERAVTQGLSPIDVQA